MNDTPQSVVITSEKNDPDEKGNDWSQNDLFRSPSHSSLSSLEDHRPEVLHSRSEDDVDDDIAKAMTQLRSFQSLQIGETLIERAALTDSIDWLSRHVPRCVLTSLKFDAISMVQESQQRNDHAKRGIIRRMMAKPIAPPVEKIMKLPHADTYQAALLFVDISGFTSLSQGLDLNTLSKSINSYFEAIVDEITAHGGDVLKFAGDAIFAEWRSNDSTMSVVMNDDQEDTKKRLFRKNLMERRKSSFDQNESFWNSSKCGVSLEDCVLSAAICGASIVKKCADYPIYLEPASGIQCALLTTLNVHCGLGVGDVAGVHVGNEYNRREYLILGSAIDQVSDACSAAALGEIRASSEAIEYLNSGKILQERILLKDGEKSALIASKHDVYFHTRKKRTRTLSGRLRKPLNPSVRRYSLPMNEMDTFALRCLHTLLKCYVHPVVVADEEARYKNSISRDNQNIQERHRAEAELRSVFTIFIQPAVDVTLTGDSDKDSEVFEILNSIMVIITSILDRFKGHLRQYIVDDKGVVVIATFGLRGSTFPNLVSERALPASRMIHAALKNELGIYCQIGASLGKAYCGVVGGVKRHEFAVLGPSVNLSARLMTLKNNPGILVDDEVRSKTPRQNFAAFLPVVAKGYPKPVSVYQPLTAKESRWGKVDPRFLGRKKEVALLQEIASNMTEHSCLPKMILVSGESGCGTSSFLVHALAVTRKFLSINRKKVKIIRNISNDNDSLIPFSLLRSIFKDLLSEKYVDDDGVSRNSGSLRNSVGHISDFKRASHLGSVQKGSYRDLDAHSVASSLSTLNLSKTSRILRLRELCEEMNAPKGFLELVAHLLLSKQQNIAKIENTPVISDVIEFIANLFIKLTSNVQLVIIVLDSIQWLDAMSWDVVQKIFEIGKNVLIVGSSRPLEVTRLPMNELFWKDLNQKYRNDKRFYEARLGPLEEEEVKEMAAITFHCNSEELDDDFISDIYSHCNGMPYFVAEVLDGMVRTQACKRMPNGKMSCAKNDALKCLSFASIDDILLHRLDHLSDFARKVLQFASAFGLSFDYIELVDLSIHVLNVSSEDKYDHLNTLRKALQEAVEEGILDEFVKDDDSVDETHEDLSSMMVQVVRKDNHEEDSKYHITNAALDGIETDRGATLYSFRHDKWRRLVTSLMLDSWKRDIHKHAALSIEEKMQDSEDHDYHTKIKLFRHWKKAHNPTKVAELALDIGQSLKHFGLNPQSVKVYQQAQAMWQSIPDESDEENIDGFSLRVLKSLDEVSFINLIKIRTALGQAIGSTVSQQVSAKVFEDTLKILRLSPVGAKMKDRSIAFPIYSGLFFLLKYGGLVDPAEEEAYENDLIANFVQETEQHGDPVHYGRALAMQGETFHRMGKYEKAIESHFKLRKVYVPDLHSAAISRVYATDRCAQNFSCTVSCYNRLGKVDKALELSDYIVEELMPKMDLKNVHNSAVMLYAVVWIMKDNGQVERASKIWTQYVLDPFRRYFGEDGSTPCLPAFVPMEHVFNLTMYMEGAIDTYNEKAFEWALDESSHDVSPGIDVAMGNFARTVTSINAEVCLRLAKITNDEQIKTTLLKHGLIQAKIAKERSKLSHALAQLQPVYDEIIEQAKAMSGVSVE